MMGLGVYCVYMDLFFFFFSREEMQLLHFFLLLDLLKLYSFTDCSEAFSEPSILFQVYILSFYLFFKNWNAFFFSQEKVTLLKLLMYITL